MHFENCKKTTFTLWECSQMSTELEVSNGSTISKKHVLELILAEQTCFWGVQSLFEQKIFFLDFSKIFGRFSIFTLHFEEIDVKYWKLSRSFWKITKKYFGANHDFIAQKYVYSPCFSSRTYFAKFVMLFFPFSGVYKPRCTRHQLAKWLTTLRDLSSPGKFFLGKPLVDSCLVYSTQGKCVGLLLTYSSQ